MLQRFTEANKLPDLKIEIPKGKPLYMFYPNKTFHSEEFSCDYVKDMKYTVREGNILLDNIIKNEWLPLGKVRV